MMSTFGRVMHYSFSAVRILVSPASLALARYAEAIIKPHSITTDRVCLAWGIFSYNIEGTLYGNDPP